MAYPSSWDFVDDFTGSGGDDDPLDNHSPSGGSGSWSSAAGNADNLIRDDTNDGVYHAGEGTTQWNGATAEISGGWSDDHFAEADGGTQSEVNYYCCPAVRITLDGSNKVEGYIVRFNSGVNRWQIIERTQSVTETLLENALLDTGKVNTDVIGLDASGSNLRAYLNGSAIGSGVSDTTFSTGKPGIIGRRAGAATNLDNFRAAGAASTAVSASGTPTLTAITASGTATNTSINPASGTPSLAEITSTGTAGYLLDATGAATLTEVTANGAVQTILGVYGTPSLTELTASGNVTTTQQILEASGAATATAMTAAGNSYRTTVSITVVDGDNAWDDGSNGLVITGTNFVN